MLYYHNFKCQIHLEAVKFEVAPMRIRYRVTGALINVAIHVLWKVSVTRRTLPGLEKIISLRDHCDKTIGHNLHMMAWRTVGFS